ncbi:hypothetical protein ACQJBY_018426 [Aegilops geniculata]
MRTFWEIPKDSEFRYAGMDWLQMLLLSQPENVKNNMLLSLWQAWSLRNNTVHGDGKDTITGSVQFLLRLHNELLLAAGDPFKEGRKNKQSLFPAKACIPATPVPNHLTAPPAGKEKLNTDVAYLEESGDTWGGVVARDHKGHVLLSVVCQLGRCSSAEEIEGAAAVMGVT